MMAAFFSGLRSRLLLLVLLSCVPSIFLTLNSCLEQSREATARAREEALRLVQLAAFQHERIIGETQRLLTTLAHLPEVRNRDTARCETLFADILKDSHWYANIMAFEPDGTSFASALPLASPVSAAGSKWFDETILRRSCAVGDLEIGLVSGRAVVVFCCPVLDENSQLDAILVASLDLAWLNDLVSGMKLPSGAAFTIRNAEGRILARYPNDGRWVGKMVADAPVFLAIKTDPNGGTAEAAGIDGVTRLYGFVPLRGGDGDPLFVSMGVPSQTISGPIRQRSLLNMVVLTVITLLALAGAWLVSHAFIVEPVESLLDATHRLASGDLETRTGWAETKGELGQLARHLDIMAANLQRRTREQMEAQEDADHWRRLSDSILRSAGEGIMGLDAQGHITFANLTCTRMLGWEPQKLIGRPIRRILGREHDVAVPVDYLQPAEDRCAGVDCTIPPIGGQCCGDDQVFWRHDGTSFPVDYVITPIEEDAGPSGFVLVFKDITTRKKTEEEHLRLITALEQSAEIILITDTEGSTQYANPAFERVTGYGHAEILGRRPDFLLSDRQDNAFFRIIQSTIRRGRMWNGRLTLMRKDHKSCEVEGSISPVFDASNQIINTVAVLRDVTHETRLEAQLHQAQKMEAIGTLAGGIAHDFNNILTAILGYTELTHEALLEGSHEKANLDHVLQAAQRARALVSRILAFSRQTEHEKKPTRLIPVIQETIGLLRGSLPSTIAISENLEAEEDTLLADATEMQQVLMNLCTNAAHAMRESGGVLDIALTTIELDKNNAAVFAGLEPGSYLKLTVQDTGHGMDRATLARIFDPYFTTKGMAEGTGLGLSVVHGIVKNHGGAVSAYSEPEHGSTFHVYLPRLGGDTPIEGKPTRSLPRGTERILFVDDEKAIVDLAREVMEQLGYTVTASMSSQEALDLFRAQPHSFDLVITDLTMPQLTGLSLTNEILRIRPDLPIILCTGFSEGIDRDRTRLLGIRRILKKPLLIRDLAEIIRQVLDEDIGESVNG